MLVYFDSCSLQRPFDDRTQLKIQLDADAMISLIECVENGSLQLVSSEALQIENEQMQNLQRKAIVNLILQTASVFIESNDSVIELAKKWQNSGLKFMDAVHLSSAFEAKADVFCTTDSKLYHKAIQLKIDQPKIMTPLQLLQEVIQ